MLIHYCSFHTKSLLSPCLMQFFALFLVSEACFNVSNINDVTCHWCMTF